MTCLPGEETELVAENSYLITDFLVQLQAQGRLELPLKSVEQRDPGPQPLPRAGGLRHRRDNDRAQAAARGKGPGDRRRLLWHGGFLWL